jgi:hypothetical protein
MGLIDRGRIKHFIFLAPCSLGVTFAGMAGIGGIKKMPFNSIAFAEYAV